MRKRQDAKGFEQIYLKSNSASFGLGNACTSRPGFDHVSTNSNAPHDLQFITESKYGTFHKQRHSNTDFKILSLFLAPHLKKYP